MKPARIHIIRVQIDYSKYDPVVYYIDTRVFPDTNPYNLFRDNEALSIICTKVEMRLLNDGEWEEFDTTGKINNEQVIGYDAAKEVVAEGFQYHVDPSTPVDMGNGTGDTA